MKNGIGPGNLAADGEHALDIKTLCDQIAKVEPEDTQSLFGDLHKMATLYYEGALQQARESFKAAQIAAAIGTLFFLAALAFLMMPGSHTGAWISIIPGAMVQVISGLNFHMYRKATRQFEVFHVCLERMGRYLMANSVCANIEDPVTRSEARLELVRVMAHAPMLPIEGSDEQRSKTRPAEGAESHPQVRTASA